MYCGICIEVCPFDALHWSPEFEYAELDIRDLLHEKDRLGQWMPTVPPPSALDEHSAEPAEIGATTRPGRLVRTPPTRPDPRDATARRAAAATARTEATERPEPSAGARGMTALDVAFAAVGLVTAASGLLAVTTRHVVHAALWLVVCLGAVAGCYLVLGRRVRRAGAAARLRRRDRRARALRADADAGADRANRRDQHRSAAPRPRRPSSAPA